MKYLIQSVIILMLAVLSVAWASDDTAPIRRYNGRVIEGTVKEVTSEGLVMELSKGAGTKTFPWRMLSKGTRYRYERNKPGEPASSGDSTNTTSQATTADTNAPAPAKP